MTREEFMKAIILLDKKNGNYKETTKWLPKREERLKRASQQYIDVFSHLVKKGLRVFAMELLQGNGSDKAPNHWSHLYLPEINCSIRFMPKGKDEMSERKALHRLWAYLNEHREYCFTFVVHPNSDLDYIDAKVKEVAGYYSSKPRKGINIEIVKKKRERIKVAPTYEKLERKPKIE